MTQSDENRSLYLSYHEHCNGHDSDRMATYYTSPIKVNGTSLDPAVVAAQFPPLFVAFPDWHWEILNVVADRDYVVGRFKGTGTHRGDFQGVKATGRQVTISECTLYRVETANSLRSGISPLTAKAASLTRCVVRLSVEERLPLEAMIRKRKRPAQRLLKARILLKADVSEGSKPQ